MGKLLNAGQACIAPDYVFVPEDTMNEFVAALEAEVRSLYPSLRDNAEYTSVINDNHYARLEAAVEEARQSGAEVREINPAGEDLSNEPQRKLTPTLVIEPDDDLQVMQEEIFGPVLPVKSYREIDEVISYINDRPRPLCLYYFGVDAEERSRVLSRTTSGGVTVNDVLIHALMEALPFGGVGASGVGVYRGVDGFRAFSHPRAVFTSSKINLWKLMGLQPPYGKALQRTLARELKV